MKAEQIPEGDSVGKIQSYKLVYYGKHGLGRRGEGLSDEEIYGRK
jgi:hypothetical protein